MQELRAGTGHADFTLAILVPVDFSEPSKKSLEYAYYYRVPDGK